MIYYSTMASVIYSRVYAVTSEFIHKRIVSTNVKSNLHNAIIMRKVGASVSLSLPIENNRAKVKSPTDSEMNVKLTLYQAKENFLGSQAQHNNYNMHTWLIINHQLLFHPLREKHTSLLT